jgi:LuxR family transcriptional regulator, maltose regulon positive regulatory protein
VLRRRHPEVEPELLARAAHWHLQRGEAEPAAAYLIEEGEWSELLELVDDYGRYFFERRAEAKLLGWLDAVPFPSGHPEFNKPVL